MYSVYAGEAAITGRNDARFRRAADKCRIDVKQIEGGAGWLTIHLAWAIRGFLK
jgi:hypothetical protein